jgi:hypothetical protein
MAQEVQYRGGGTAWHATFTGAARELTVNSDTNRLHVHDGSTAGGHPLALLSEAGSGGVAEADVVLVDGTNPMEADLDLDGNAVVNVVDPTDPQDAATKAYVDAAVDAGVADGDKGDITVSDSGVEWTINDESVTYAKIQDVSATDRILGRSTAGAGVVEEIPCTAAGRALIDDADADAQLATLGGTAATGSGAVVRATSPTLVTPALGTPSSGTLTNCTGLPTAGLVDDSVTYAKIQDVSATDRLLGRSTAGAGVVEEIPCTAAGRAILDDATGAAQLETMAGAAPTGSGGVARATSPTFVTPALGTPSSGTLTNCTGLPTAGLVDDAVTYAKIQDVSATDRLLGRSTAGAGVVEEIACTAAGRALIDDADADAQLATLGGATPTGTGAVVRATGPTITNANVECANTGFKIKDAANDHEMTISVGDDLNADRTLTITLNDASRNFTLGGNLSTAGAVTITNAAATVLDDTTVAAMVDTLGGATSTGTGGIARATSPTFVTPALGTVASGNVAACAGMFYPLQVGFTTYNPNDSATNYFGNRYNSPTASADVSRVYIRKPGTIIGADLWTFAATAGDADAWEWFIRLNNTTDYSIQSVATSATGRRWTNSSLSIAVVNGDYFEIKMVNPTWAGTNPASISCGGSIYVQT